MQSFVLFNIKKVGFVLKISKFIIEQYLMKPSSSQSYVLMLYVIMTYPDDFLLKMVNV